MQYAVLMRVEDRSRDVDQPDHLGANVSAGMLGQRRSLDELRREILLALMVVDYAAIAAASELCDIVGSFGVGTGDSGVSWDSAIQPCAVGSRLLIHRVRRHNRATLPRVDDVAASVNFGASPIIRAVVQDGLIRPLDPLPPHWIDGRQLIVEDAELPSTEDLQAWYC
jgi:hypothetical protein